MPKNILHHNFCCTIHIDYIELSQKLRHVEYIKVSHSDVSIYVIQAIWNECMAFIYNMFSIQIDMSDIVLYHNFCYKNKAAKETNIVVVDAVVVVNIDSSSLFYLFSYFLSLLSGAKMSQSIPKRQPGK